MSTVLLFVYGSLKRGARHHAELASARFMGEAQTAPGYALIQLGDYLALVHEPDAGVVQGELFEVPEALLPVLDEFEGDAYMRQNVPVKPAGAVEASVALAYLMKAR